MNAVILCLGAGFFLIAFIVHLAWWHLARPKDDLKVLALCMAAVPVFVTVPLYLLSPSNPLELLLALIMAWAMGVAYLFWYPAAQAASPTMLITILVHRSGSRGMSGSARHGSPRAGGVPCS